VVGQELRVDFDEWDKYNQIVAATLVVEGMDSPIAKSGGHFAVGLALHERFHRALGRSPPNDFDNPLSGSLRRFSVR
jgi:hypothetical protein